MLALLLALCLQQESMETLLRRFGEDDPGKRDDAAKAILERWKDWKDADLDRLRKAGGDPDGELAGRAKETLSSIELRRRLGETVLREIPDIESVIREAAPDVRWNRLLVAASLWKSGKLDEGVLRTLAAIGTERAWPLDTDQRKFLCALPEVNVVVPAYAPFMAPLLKSADPEERVLAATYLGGLGAVAYAAEVAALLKNVDKAPRVAAIRALGQMNAKAFSGAVAELLDPTEAYEIKLAAIETLGRLRAPDTEIARVVPYLADGAPDVVQHAVDVLGHAGNRSLAPKVAEFLKSDNPATRSGAADVLGRMGAVEQAAALAELLREPRSNAARQAVESLGRMGAAAQADLVAAALRDPDESIRAAAARALGRMGAVSKAAELYPLFNDASIDARWNAVASLGELLTPETAGEAVKLLSSDTHFIRGLAANVLGRVGDARHADAIAALFDEGQPFVRAEAAKAVAALGAAKHRKAIALLLEDEFEEVRTDSALSLGRLAVVPPQGAEAEELLKQLEEATKSLTVPARQAATVGLAWHGRNTLPTLQSMRDEGQEFPEVLFDGLAWLHEREAYVRLTKPIAVERPIDSMARLEEALGGVGLRLDNAGALLFVGRIPPGRSTTARRLLQNLWEAKYIVLQNGKVRMLPRDEAYAAWEARLKAK